ncbi:ATP-binding protein [Treponema primitia]|uniref:ATP-binding protein n=1 Tax=Treponema primitia TaxID=88058 RepID=UPI0002554D3E|nr:ATP-binding protein [Treponema primitia]
MINRPEYLADLLRWKDKDDLIKIITGVRRCGKSTLLMLFQDYLRNNGVKDSQILDINLEMAANDTLLDWKALHRYVEGHAAKGKKTYVLLDEIQMVSDFPRAVNSLRLKKNIDVYVTGSNASMLSKDIKNVLGGRTIEIKMLPFSFKEYLSSFPENDRTELDKKYNDYVTRGSFPQTIEFYTNTAAYDERAWHTYMDSVYNTIIVKDVLSRQGIQEFSKLERVIAFMFSTIGSETSINNMGTTINNDMKGKPTDSKIHALTIERYLESLLDGYVFYKVNPSYLRGKNRLRSNAKYYAVDAGLRYFLLGGTAINDAGHVLENVVYLELLRRGYDVEFGKIGDTEIDFVARKPGGKVEYYQVTQTLMDKKVLERELGPLQQIQDNYPKFILSRDYDSSNFAGIRHINVLEWLTKK